MTPVEIARRHVARRTRWEHQARGPASLDCIGLLVEAYAAYGIKDRTDYDRNPRDGKLERQIAEQFGPSVRKEDMRPGDVVCLAFPKVVRHVGIIGDYPGGHLSLIHTSGSTQCVTEHRLDSRWLKRIKSVHRPEKLF